MVSCIFIRFILGDSGKFRALAPTYTGDLRPPALRGLSSAEVRTRRELFGHSQDFATALGLKNYGTFLFSPLFTFQIFCVVVWLLDKYFLYALIVSAMALASSLLSIFESIQTISSLYSIAQENSRSIVSVIREGVTHSIPAGELVVDDLLEISSQMTLPCDCLLLSGEILADLSLLTGGRNFQG
jgi:magnesium-transporting ATPase (P-type)